MKLLILNDTHLGVKRQAGTTKESRKDLENWMLDEFETILEVIEHDAVLILGDLFDKRNVDEHVMNKVVELLRGEEVIIVAGNHDLGGVDDHTMSSAEFVANMSGSYWLADPEDIFDGALWVVPHMHSQEEFDHAVQICPRDTIMLTHCNIDSPWAHGDHSLNLSLHQLKDLESRGVDVICGHEHTKREYHNAYILGNQFPSSIADCLGGDKYAHILEDGAITEIKTWKVDDGYCEIDEPPKHDLPFMNVVGECDLTEYASIVKEVANLRKKSDAFIIKNSVKVREFEADVTAEEVTQFNVIDMLLEEIDPGYREEVKECL